MGRKLRVQYPGAIYHVMNRGDRREPIFDDDLDRQRFLQTLGEACEKTDWQVHACYGEERRESAEEKARRLVADGLRTARWTEADLRRRRKSDPVKIGLAAQLRRETTMTLKWIAERLQMGAWTHLNKRLYEHRKEGGARNVE